jgi:hypothetical protein
MKKITLVLGIVFILIGVVLTGSGCKIADSSDVNPHSIYPLFSVIEETGVSGTTVTAKLRLGSETGVVVDLNDGERLYCNNILLDTIHGLFDVTYKSMFYSSYPQYVFRYDREGEVIDTTMGAIPAIINEGYGLTVQWNTGMGTGDEVVLTVVVNSIMNYKYWVLPDTGSYTIPSTALYDLVKYYGPTDYTYRVEVSRRDLYGVNPYFEKGGKGLIANIDKKTFTYHKTSLAVEGVHVQQLEQNMKAELEALKIGDIIQH